MAWELRQSFLHCVLGGSTFLTFLNTGREDFADKVHDLRNALALCNYPFTHCERFSPTMIQFQIFWNVNFEKELTGINNVTECITIFNRQTNFRTIKDYLSII